jgi:hypothetical protein
METLMEIILKEMKSIIEVARRELERKEAEAKEKLAVLNSLLNAYDRLEAQAKKTEKP